MNPTSTKPAGKVEIVIYDDKTQKDTLNRDYGNLWVQTYIPYTLASSKYSLSRSEKGPGLATVCTITFSLEHSLLADSGVIVGYPAEVSADPVQRPLKVTVDASEYGHQKILNQPKVDYSARQIIFVGERGFADPLLVNDGT